MTPPGPRLIAGMPEPSRTRVPDCGSLTPTDVRLEFVTGADHVVPWASERTARSAAVLGPPLLSISVKMLTSTSVPGTTTICLPRDWFCGPGSEMLRGAGHVEAPVAVPAK